MPHSSAHTEAALIASARVGDERAFELLAQAYTRVLEFHIKRVDRDPAHYDELFQEGLIGLLKAVRSYDGVSSSFATFASLCIRNSIISGVRRIASNATKTVPVSEIFSDADTAPSAESVILDRERAEVLYSQVMSELSPYERTVFELYLSDMSYESIAFATERSVKSIRNAVTRIRNKLRQTIGNADGFASPTTDPKPKG